MNWKQSARIAVACLVLGGLTSACTLEKFDGDSSDFTPSRETFDSIFASASLICEDPNNCPGNVGLIVFPSRNEKGEPGFSQCTGTLVGEDLVLTASHCIPEVAKVKGADCSISLGFIRSAADRFPQKIRCSEVLIFSDYKTNSIDYALFRLKEKATTNPYRISRKGFPDLSTVHSFTIDPSGDTTVQGTMRRKTCQTVMRSVVAPTYVHPLSSLVSLTGDQTCMLIGGNSGSSVFFQEEVRAVVSQGRKTADKKQLIKGKDVKLGVGVNLACFELPGFSRPSSECANSSNETIYDQLKTTDGIVSYSKAAIEQVTEMSPPLYRYRFEITDRNQRPDGDNILARLGHHEYLRLKFSMTPYCVIPRNLWARSGIVPVTNREGSQVIMIAPPSAGDLKITLSIDDQNRVVAQGRILNVAQRMTSIPVATLGEALPWCSDTESTAKFSF